MLTFKSGDLHSFAFSSSRSSSSSEWIKFRRLGGVASPMFIVKELFVGIN